MKYRMHTWLLVSILAAVFTLTGCPPKKKLAIDEKPAEEKVDETAQNDAADKAAADAANSVEIKQDWTDIPNLQVIQFGYDSATLDDAARSTLKSNVAI